MRKVTAIGLIMAALLLSACAGGSGGDGIGFREGLNDLGSSVGGGFGRDTYGTNRRTDVYGASTAPSLPSIGAPGLGK